MAEQRSKPRPYKVDSSPEGAREGDVPYYARWNDGSEYWAVPVSDNCRDGGWRSFHGPMFGRALGDIHRERF